MLFHVPVPIRGCFPMTSPLPLLGPVPILSSPMCELKESGPVSACMCTTTGCNGDRNHPMLSTQQQREPRDAASREPKNFIFPFDRHSTPASPLPRGGRQSRLKCFSCGSLFNRDTPQCSQFNLSNSQQVMTCNEGEACMLYTWNKSGKEIGEQNCHNNLILG